MKVEPIQQVRKKIAIVCGGDSGEYEISISSGKVVYISLDQQKYQPYLVIIKGKSWKCELSDGTLIEVDKNDFSVTENDEKVIFDAVFNALHGTPGEDGKILGYFDIMGIPYTSSNHVTSAVTFHKDFCKQVVDSIGVNLSPSILIHKNDNFPSEMIVAELGLPVFVKPNNGGSSVGVSKVKYEGELSDAISKAFREDDEVLVEAFIKGREIGCSVLETKGRMIVFPLTEIVSKKEFFDYEAKYQGFADEITPADVDEEIELEIKVIASRLYHRLACRGFVRFDFIVNENGIFFLEVNTVPGISEASILPQQAEFMGIPLSKLFEMALENII